MKYKAPANIPDAKVGLSISGVDPDDGSVLEPLVGKDGYIEVADDWQTWHRVLLNAGYVPQTPKKEPN